MLALIWGVTQAMSKPQCGMWDVGCGVCQDMKNWRLSGCMSLSVTKKTG